LYRCYVIVLYLTCSTSYGVYQYLDLWNVNKLNIEH
jgi:hypothetical protein